MANPIYVTTHYIQRKKIIGDIPVGATNPDVSEIGYGLIPGRIVDLYLYNTAAARYQPAGTFWEPQEFTDFRVATFLNGAGQGSSPADAFFNDHDAFKIKFVDTPYIPWVRHDDDEGIVTGYIQESTHGLKASDLALASG